RGAHRVRAPARLLRRRGRARSRAPLHAPHPPRCAAGGVLTMATLAQAVWLALPVILGGAVHVAVIKLELLRGLARVPLDAGITVRGRRLFGDHKTLRGAVTMIGATTGFVVLQTALVVRGGWATRLSLLNFARIHPLLWGLVLGGGYVVG